MWTKIRSTWLDNDRHWLQRPLLAHFRRKMAQLGLLTKIRTKHWLVLCASAFQCMRVDFLCPKYNSACLHTRQDQNKLHLKRWFFFFFLTKSASSVSRSQAHLAKRCSSEYTTIFVRRKDKSNYLSNQTLAKCYHSRNKH